MAFGLRLAAPPEAPTLGRRHRALVSHGPMSTTTSTAEATAEPRRDLSLRPAIAACHRGLALRPRREDRSDAATLREFATPAPGRVSFNEIGSLTSGNNTVTDRDIRGSSGAVGLTALYEDLPTR
ncbi:hypothetical protein LY13_000393 [Prauserella aidingensis]|nr:hypothetical protein [Prauserella aidingensis]